MGHVDEQQYELTGRAELATQAIEAYKKALELAPGSPVIPGTAGEIYAKSQRMREAVEQAQATLKADPNNVDAHRLLARIYVRELGDLSAGDVQIPADASLTQVFDASRCCNQFVFRNNLARNGRRVGVLAKGVRGADREQYL